MTTGIQRIYKSESTQFTTVPNWVVRDPNYTPNAFRLLAYLLSHQDGYELTYGQIERQTSLGRYAINQAAKFLIAEGWLEWEQEQGSNGQWLAKTWILKDPNSMIPLPNESTTESFHYGTINGHKEEQVKEKNTNKRKTLLEQDNVFFEEFWSAYPKKADKRPAQKAFASALKRSTFDELMAGVIAYKELVKDTDVKFIKNPATWLNADAWENEIQPSAESEAAERARLRKQRDLQASKQFLEEQQRQAELAKPPPNCEHGVSIVRCRKCLS